ncbi:MAG: CocE/NonD family hydrolase [Thermomicrobiales bacterium]|nr:CocE/NonD family hydrolase [Thermomicrobiales bacterium]
MRQHVRIQHDLPIPMSDGVNLSADLYLPPDGTTFPTALCRTIYDNQQDRYVDWAVEFASNGYAVVLQDCRGRYDSEGVWEPYVCEARDGYDTQQWIGQQPWCDGNIGMFGISYVGFTQVLPAPYRSPYVKGLVPCANQEDNFGHFYVDGVFQLQNAVNLGWIGRRSNRNTSWPYVDRRSLYERLPLSSALDGVTDMPTYQLFLQHPTFDDYWKSYSLKERYEEIDVPAMFLTGWYDNLVHEQFKCFTGWSQRAKSDNARRKTKIVCGPWPHKPMGSTREFHDVDFGPDAEWDIPKLHMRWYDQQLKGIDNGIDDEPALHLFVMGENVWRFESEWPLARTEWTSYYLHSDGNANSRLGDGLLLTTPPASETPDSYVYDPANPVPTLGGQSMFLENCGPLDRSELEQRDDILVYSTPPLERDTEVTGPIKLMLYASTDCVDTDFSGTLIDVHPDGKAINLCEGIARARYRESLESPTLIEPGQTYQYTIDLWETSNLFKAGHQIRVEISSSNFPRFARNLNTGGDIASETEMRVANQTIFHDAARPSHLILPVIPRGE